MLGNMQVLVRIQYRIFFRFIPFSSTSRSADFHSSGMLAYRAVKPALRIVPYLSHTEKAAVTMVTINAIALSMRSVTNLGQSYLAGDGSAIYRPHV